MQSRRFPFPATPSLQHACYGLSTAYMLSMLQPIQEIKQMYEKLLIAHQSLMLLIASGLIVMLFQTDNSKRLNELEHRATNHLTYLEQKVNNVDSRLDTTTNELRHNLKMIELRHSAAPHDPSRSGATLCGSVCAYQRTRHQRHGRLGR